MKQILTNTMSAMLTGRPVLLEDVRAEDEEKQPDQDRLKNCGTVLNEILNIRDQVLKGLCGETD